MSFTNIPAAAALTTASLCGSLAAQPLDQQFNQLEVGDRCSVVTAAMGEPTSKSTSSTLGLAHTRMQWSNGSRTYVITCVLDRLGSKRVCQGLVAC